MVYCKKKTIQYMPHYNLQDWRMDEIYRFKFKNTLLIHKGNLIIIHALLKKIKMLLKTTSPAYL